MSAKESRVYNTNQPTSNFRHTEWLRSNRFVHSFRAIQNRLTHEYAIFGHYGQIYKFGDGTYRAIVTAPKIANRLCRYLKRRGGYKVGEEALLSFNVTQFDHVATTLQILRYSKRQIEAANRFGRLPHEICSILTKKKKDLIGQPDKTNHSVPSKEAQDTSDFEGKVAS